MIFFNAKIFKTSDEIIEKGFIKTKNEFISEVSCNQNELNFNSSNETFINCDGLKIVPGFVDSHCHVGMWENGLNFEGDDGNEETDPVCCHLRAIDGINPLDESFCEALKAGITTIVTGPGSANPIGGNFIALKTFGNCVDDMIVKNSVGIKFALGENPKNVYHEKGEFPTTRMAIAAIIRETLKKAQQYKKRIIESKTEDLSSEEPDFDFKLESLISLLNREVKAFFHCHRSDDIFTAIRIAKEFNLDYVLVHATEAHLVLNKLINSKIICGPLVCDKLKPELKNHSVSGIANLFKAKLNIALCSDHPVVPSSFFLPTCAILKKYGLCENDILKLITQAPAIICGIFDKVGSIEKQKYANFVAFNATDDIFSCYVEPKFVVLDGKIVYNNFN